MEFLRWLGQAALVFAVVGVVGMVIAILIAGPEGIVGAIAVLIAIAGVGYLLSD